MLHTVNLTIKVSPYEIATIATAESSRQFLLSYDPQMIASTYRDFAHAREIGFTASGNKTRNMWCRLLPTRKQEGAAQRIYAFELIEPNWAFIHFVAPRDMPDLSGKRLSATAVIELAEDPASRRSRHAQLPCTLVLASDQDALVRDDPDLDAVLTRYLAASKKRRR